jgi:general secretion pathway protein F
MVYPGFVVVATIATLTAFVFFVVPTLAGAFEGSEAKLPESTRNLLALSAWLKAHGLLTTAGIGAVGTAIWTSPWARRLLARGVDWLLSSPIGLGIAPRLDFAGFAGLAALSLEAGVPTAGALEAAAAGVRSQTLAAGLSAAVLAIRVGERPSDAIERTTKPPPALVRLLQVGEETGDLVGAMRQAARLLEAEAEQRMQRLGAIAGPVITMTLGALVANVVLSLFLGLLSMSDLAAN